MNGYIDSIASTGDYEIAWDERFSPIALIADEFTWDYGQAVGGSYATPTLVKEIDSQADPGANTFVTLTVPAGGVALGNTILIGGIGTSSRVISSVTDTGGNVYTVDASKT